MSQAIRVVLQQPGQQPGSTVMVPLHQGKIHIASIREKFGLTALVKVTPTYPVDILMYEDVEGWSLCETFVAGETLTVRGPLIAGAEQQERPVLEGWRKPRFSWAPPYTHKQEEI